MDDQVGAAHEVRHVAEELPVRLEIALRHEARIAEHPSEHRVFIDRPILHPTLTLPHDLLLLLEALVQKVHLWER